MQRSPRFAPENGWEAALIIARWPEPRPAEGWEAGKLEAFNLVMDVVRAIRNLRSEKNVQPGRRLPAVLVSADHVDILQEQSRAICTMARLDREKLTIAAHLPAKPSGHIALVVGSVEIFLPLAELVNPAEERARLQKDLVEAESQVERLEQLLAGPFAEKAPAPVVQKERDKLAAYLAIVSKIRVQIDLLR